MTFGITHMTLRNLKGVIGLTAVLWIVLVVVVHRNLVIQHKRLDNNVASFRHRSEPFSTVNCGKTIVNIRDKHCAKRIDFLDNLQGRNSCFESFGISPGSSKCAILRYLVYVERICLEPDSAHRLFSYLPDGNSTELQLLQNAKIERAKCTTKLYSLIRKMDECGKVCEWMKIRIQNFESDWLKSISRFANQNAMEIDGEVEREENEKYRMRRRQTIVLHMGLLSRDFGLNFGEGAFAGGPLGELVQWADLAASLELLGHKIIFSWSPERLEEVLKPRYDFGNDCRRGVQADIVFTDMYGLEQIKMTLGTLNNYRCRLRILDVYGTEPEYNHPRYKNEVSTSGTWGGKGLDLKQFYTQFPHTPDNSFLGFVINKREEMVEEVEAKRNRVLLYGKQLSYLKSEGISEFLKILHKYFKDIHATMKFREGEDVLPDYVINHGSLSQEEFMKLLRSSRIYIGLGLPVEGPAALEAIANGVIFLNPKFSPPLDAHEGKPTNRRLTSQNPYAEKYIGEPYVYTVDINNLDEVERVLQEIQNSEEIQSKVNHEFTRAGFIERVNAYIENQDFCTSQMESDVTTGITWKRDTSTWPPKVSMKVKVAYEGESCASTCSRNNLTCERAFFTLLNNSERLNYYFDHKCKSIETLPKYLQIDSRTKPISANEVCQAPSYDLSTEICFIQSDPLLFSCACVGAGSEVRLCPCRTYAKEQIALCDGCS